ncbi:MAG: hypothetical protein U9Q81_00210 [Pseudomonadota bacterium]|nr:hypothetical protein [Pseudomonadota bacterium]
MTNLLDPQLGLPKSLSVSETVLLLSSPDGRIFIGYLRDITERKRAEEERVRLGSQPRQAQKM